MHEFLSTLQLQAVLQHSVAFEHLRCTHSSSSSAGLPKQAAPCRVASIVGCTWPALPPHPTHNRYCER